MDNLTENIADSDDGKLWILEESGYKVIRGNPKKPVVYFYSRNYHNKFETITHTFEGFRPYCLVPANEFPKLPPTCEYAEETELDCMNREVRKVYADIPKTIKDIKNLFTFTDMADFLFEKRFAVDHGIYYAYKLVGGIPVNVEIEDFLPPRVMVSDIEVLSPPDRAFPGPEKVAWPVVSIQTKDLYTGEILIFTAGNLNIEGEIIDIPQTNHPDHIACSSEKDLFRTFMAYMREINPDLLTHWNGQRFDYPYLIRRAHKMEYEINSLGRQGIPQSKYDPDSDDQFSTHIVGRSSLDMLKAYKIFYKQKAERESYDLKTVSADYGFEYTDYGYKLFELLRSKDWDTFLQYCRNDVIALENINNKTGLWNHYETLRKIAGCKLNNTLHNSVIIESAFLKYGMGPMPTKAPYNKDGEKFEGALVLVPPTGIHEWVGTVDLAALYPTVMRAFPDKCCPDPNYKVIEILELFVSERERYRALNKTDASTPVTQLIEYIFKVLANSVYGALGLKSFRLFKRECAENVTSIGREVDRFVHSRLLHHGYNTIYSDSVTGDTKLIILNKKGISIVKIEDLFTSIDYTDGEKEYCRVDGIYTKTIDDNKNVHFAPVKYVMRHFTHKKLYEVFSSHNRSVTVTEDHSLIDWNLNEVKPKNATHVMLLQFNDTVVKDDQIKIIEWQSGGCYVYDIEVQETHRFFGNGIALHNTDSSFFYQIKTPEEGKIIQDKLNADLAAWGKEKGARVNFTLKFEKLYRRILFKKDEKAKKKSRWEDLGSKKKYVGHIIWKEGEDYTNDRKLNYMGLELVRSDTSKYTKEMLTKFFEIVLIDGDTVAASKFIRKSYKDVKNGKVPYYDLSIPKQIRAASRAESPHKRGIDNTLHLFNYTIPDGTKPRLIYVKDYPYELCIDEEIDIGEWKEKIDWNILLDKNVTKKLRLYAESANIDWERVIYGQQSILQFCQSVNTEEELNPEVLKLEAQDIEEPEKEAYEDPAEYELENSEETELEDPEYN